MRVVVIDKVKRAELDRTFTFARGTGNEARVEFDSSWGTYSVLLDVPKYRCGDIDFMQVLQDHDRSLTTQLIDGVPSPVAPVLIVGSLPQSFAYAEPTVVLFRSTLTCNGPVGDPDMTGIDNQLEQDAYYATIRTAALYRRPVSVTLAVRLKDSSGGYHYIRMPWKFTSGYTWPSVGELNVEDGLIDYAAQQPEDVLLCPRFYGTSVG